MAPQSAEISTEPDLSTEPDSRQAVTEYSPFQAELKKLIKSSGPMPVWRYMELCLTHPKYGYYVARDPLGREGDFTTAPEISQMFGELLGLWAASVWKAIDSPSVLRLIELGPGRGTMMADALRALRVLPPLYQSLSVHLVEINPVVREVPVGAVFEWRPDAEIMRIATRVRDQGGAALIIDYGHLRSDAGDTFQAIAGHSFTDPLKNPGQADITAHVDFQALGRAAEDLSAQVHGPVPQGDFLKRLGIETRAVTLMAKTTPEISEDISGALKRLTGGGRGGMGSMFKVLAVSEPKLTALAGFGDEQQDARAEPL